VQQPLIIAKVTKDDGLAKSREADHLPMQFQ
jgi:hypothetical protein